MYSPSIDNLIKAFKKLPTVGQRTAERFVFNLLKSGKKDVNDLILALTTLIKTVRSCEQCWNFSDTNPCAICSNRERDSGLICVVLDPQEVMVIEESGAYRGLYHVLRGLLDASDEESLSRMKIKELLRRIAGGDKESEIKNEVILALNPDLSGETTMLFLEREIKKIYPSVKVTRLARGLPLGSDLRYADEITLGAAIKNRLPAR